MISPPTVVGRDDDTTVHPATGRRPTADAHDATTYLGSISSGAMPLLTPEQERVLCDMVQGGQRALSRAQRHLAARIRRVLVARTDGQVLLRAVAAAAADVVGASPEAAMQWGRAILEVCAERPPIDTASSDVRALHALLDGLAAGDSAARTAPVALAAPAVDEALDRLVARLSRRLAVDGTGDIASPPCAGEERPTTLEGLAALDDVRGGRQGPLDDESPASTLFLDDVPLRATALGQGLERLAALGDGLAGQAIAAVVATAPLVPSTVAAAVRPILGATLQPHEVEGVVDGWVVDLAAIRHGRDARDAVAAANLRLVVSLAKRYVGWGLELDDLVQEGTIGLLRAIDRFDPGRGYRLSTYATWWIKQALGQGVADQGRLVRLPGHIRALHRRIGRAQSDLQVSLGRTPSLREVAEAAGVPPTRIEELALLWHRPVSLDQPVGDDDGTPLGAVLAPEIGESPEQEVGARAAAGAIRAVLRSLEPRESDVLRWRYGLDDGQVQTLEEVGRRLDVTRERVRQIEVRALRKLRHPSRSAWLA